MDRIFSIIVDMVKSRTVAKNDLGTTKVAIVHSMNSDRSGLAVPFSEAPATLFGLNWR